jgi:nitrite reductase/ring-hydroxylating ferredoxin subunit
MSSSATPATWHAGEPGGPTLHRLAERVGQLRALDRVAEPLAGAVREAIPAGRVKDALSGTWLGHALHPLFTDIPIGSWTSATLLDLIGGRQSQVAADRLIAIGVAAAVPTAVTGISDWADSTRDESVRRIGPVHAVANVAALGLYSASLAARARGERGRGRLLGLAGMAALGLGGHLVGHLSYAKGVGVDRTAFLPQPQDWTDALADSDLPDGETRLIEIGTTPIMLVRHGGRVHALAARCCHRGGPLHEGNVADGQVTCPWHGSTFRLHDGSVVHGPAPYPQPVYDVRVREGRIEVGGS